MMRMMGLMVIMWMIYIYCDAVCDDDDVVDEEDVMRCHMFLFAMFHSQRCTLLILAMCATKKFVRTRCNPPQHLQEQLER